MSSNAATLGIVTGILVVVLTAHPARAQGGSATLSGIVTNGSGAIVANAKVSARNVATGQTIEAQTDASGAYRLTNLPAGDYDVSVSATGLASKTTQLKIASGQEQTLDVVLPALVAVPGPTLEDLGISPQQSQADPQLQAKLDKRSHMLKTHQRLGLIAFAPMIASIATSTGAGRKGSAESRDLHVALGSATGDLYFTSAYFAIRAPKIPGTTTRGPIRVHKILAWIHGPGMVLTPILGTMAFDQENKGEPVHGIARAHSVVAIVTASAYGAAILSVSLKF